MTTNLAERIFCDTNVLLTAVDCKRSLHKKALRVLNNLPNEGIELCISGQIIREFIAVSTRPINVNGLGLTLQQALENTKAVLKRSTLLAETEAVTNQLLQIIVAAGCEGKQIHDANIAATMQIHRINQLVTDNIAHFRRYRDIDLIDLKYI
ncbi:MAG: PIN domain-containing protein [Deltaproteobacteria bacterium]|nr:PIN domain-containing protein [Deltaproteobacteria bacterium]